ncbi:hypothetical protein QR685DRAFT_10581 [Neurospora intermedia]|uniref:Uncharacterized protein n=1 Tax=Neurospora intermedia TaxID=5142 RepID=A0ABR3DP76_NEUIN
MENEPPIISVQEDGRGTKRGRIMGKLFGRVKEDRERDRKPSHDNTGASGDLNDFFHGSSDKLQVAHPGPPTLAKLDTKTAGSTRYPNSLNVQSPTDPRHDLAIRARSYSPRIRKNKGLSVKFTDAYPEVIGHGGDECNVPTVEISKRKQVRSPMPPTTTAPAWSLDGGGRPTGSPGAAQKNDPSFTPGPLRRTQTGFANIPGTGEQELAENHSPQPRPRGSPATNPDEKRRSFIELHQAEMREAEGQAFANAVRSASISSQATRTSERPPLSATNSTSRGQYTESPRDVNLPQLYQPSQSDSLSQPTIPTSPRSRLGPSPIPAQAPRSPQTYTVDSPRTLQLPRNGALASETQHSPLHMQPQPSPLPTSGLTPGLEQSPPTSFINQFGSFRSSGRSLEGENFSPNAAQQPPTPAWNHDQSALDDALSTFATRSTHLFELFRLHSESVRPLLSSTPEQLVRAALWWFLTGRMALENAVRERPAGLEAEQRNSLAKQQAYADLAKAYWLSEKMVPEISNSTSALVDAEVEEVRKVLASNLRKLAGSMQRNGFMPPEEALLPQAIDRSIWIEYPSLTQDIISLLWGSSSSALASTQQHQPGIGMLDALPLGDSDNFFSFGRFRIEAFLMEQGRESQRLHFPCFLSILRPQKQADIMFVIASQNDSVQLRISGDKSLGPVWEDVRWRPETLTLDVRLPRGFALVLQCSQGSFKTLRSMYEFSAKVHASLYAKPDERCLFRSTLRAFQYVDNDPQARQFPREATPGCELALFERLKKEGAATGPRTYHRGYRIAVVTGPKVKTLSGVNQVYTPQTLIQLGSCRNEANDPALSLKFENGRLKGSMVMSFKDEQERSQMHSLLIGSALQKDEEVFCEVPLKVVWFSERYGDSAHNGLKQMAGLSWQRVKVINDDNDGDRPPCVLADKLRAVYDFQDGTFTDRINVAPGELRLRLDVRNPSCIMMFRQPQADATLAVTDPKIPRELSEGMAECLEVLQQSPTIRTYMFPSVGELHAFESAITGFKILFDGIASAFAISRRRMVVPIHKKWEAGSTRIQIVQQDGVTQMLTFFENFTHGQCMGFTLKGTDIFEAFNRGGKAGLKIADAKFPLPKVLPQNVTDAQAAADTAFLCLDLPELPGEHDDITILFESEAERDKLGLCLPAPVKGSRLPKK